MARRRRGRRLPGGRARPVRAGDRGLLGDSPRPWRDLGDVAWNATLERAGSVRVRQLPPHAWQMLVLVTFSAVFWFVMIVLTPVAFIVSGALGALVGHGHVRFTADNGIETGGGTGAIFTGAVLTVVLVAVLASLNAVSALFYLGR